MSTTETEAQMHAPIFRHFDLSEIIIIQRLSFFSLSSYFSRRPSDLFKLDSVDDLESIMDLKLVYIFNKALSLV